MARITFDGVTLSYEDRGSGIPIVFCHEFAQNHEGWSAQIGHLSRRYRTIAYSRRGYPPSDVPQADEDFSFGANVRDLARLVSYLDAEPAHLVGHGAGGNIALDFTIKRPDAVRSLTLVGSVAGSDDAEAWKAAAEVFASRMENHGSEGLVSGIASAPQRQAFRERDEGGWERFVESMERLSAQGCARAMRSALSRPSVLELGGALASLDVPILLILGDQDLPSFGGSLFILRTASRASLAVMPACGHTENLEDPDLFNRLLSEFLIGVDCARAASR